MRRIWRAHLQDCTRCRFYLTAAALLAVNLVVNLITER